MDVLADHWNASDGSSFAVCPMGGKLSIFWNEIEHALNW